MAWIRIPGSARQYQNTETGEVLSRRQFDKRFRGIQSYEKKASLNKLQNLKESLARPARGRAKARTSKEKQQRVELEEKRQEIKLQTRLEKLAQKQGARVKPKRIRKQLLKPGHMSERVSFNNEAQFDQIMSDARNASKVNGMRLISAISFGVIGYDERTGQQLGAIIVSAQNPYNKFTFEDLEDIRDDWLNEHSYVIFSHYFAHLRYNSTYATEKAAKANKKNLRGII